MATASASIRKTAGPRGPRKNIAPSPPAPARSAGFRGHRRRPRLLRRPPGSPPRASAARSRFPPPWADAPPRKFRALLSSTMPSSTISLRRRIRPGAPASSSAGPLLRGASLPRTAYHRFPGGGHLDRYQLVLGAAPAPPPPPPARETTHRTGPPPADRVTATIAPPSRDLLSGTARSPSSHPHRPPPSPRRRLPHPRSWLPPPCALGSNPPPAGGETPPTPPPGARTIVRYPITWGRAGHTPAGRDRLLLGRPPERRDAPPHRWRRVILLDHLVASRRPGSGPSPGPVPPPPARARSPGSCAPPAPFCFVRARRFVAVCRTPRMARALACFGPFRYTSPGSPARRVRGVSPGQGPRKSKGAIRRPLEQPDLKLRPSPAGFAPSRSSAGAERPPRRWVPVSITFPPPRRALPRPVEPHGGLFFKDGLDLPGRAPSLVPSFPVGAATARGRRLARPGFFCTGINSATRQPFPARSPASRPRTAATVPAPLRHRRSPGFCNAGDDLHHVPPPNMFAHHAHVPRPPSMFSPFLGSKMSFTKHLPPPCPAIQPA